MAKAGRKPKDPRNAGVSGEGSIHLGLRFAPERAQALARIVEASNQRAKEAGLPGVFTASALVVNIINDWIDEETAKLDALEAKRDPMTPKREKAILASMPPDHRALFETLHPTSNREMRDRGLRGFEQTNAPSKKQKESA